MTNFVVIFISLFAGILCQRVKKFPTNSGIALNLFVIYVSLPTLILSRFPPLIQGLELRGHWWMPVGMAWMTFLISILVVVTLSKKYHWSDAKTGVLILTVGLGNTSFVGFPLLEALIGKEAIQIGILADQPGSFLVLSTLGLFIATKYSGAESHFKMMFKRVFLFPPFVAMLVAIFWTVLGLPAWSYLADPLDRVAMSLVPLALFSVGFQTNFKLSLIRRRVFPLAIGLGFKLILMPAIFFILFYKIFGLNDLYARVSVLESAMATQITAAVVVAEFNLDSELANLMVGLSIPLSLITVPIWNYLIFQFSG